MSGSMEGSPGPWGKCLHSIPRCREGLAGLEDTGEDGRRRCSASRQDAEDDPSDFVAVLHRVGFKPRDLLSVDGTVALRHPGRETNVFGYADAMPHQRQKRAFGQDVVGEEEQVGDKAPMTIA